MSESENKNKPEGKTPSPAVTKKKPKGPIRLEAIVPVTVIVILFGLYFKLFFDSNLRMGLEWGLSKANTAEVNIKRLNTSFIKGTLEISGIEFTNPERPSFNRLDIGEIGFQLLWDALLRGKIVIERAALTGLGAGSPRVKPGFVIPPEPDDGKTGMIDIVKGQAVNQAKKQYEKSTIPELVNFIQHVNPMEELKKIVTELKTPKRIDQLKIDVLEKEKSWEKKIAALPSQKDITVMQAKVQGIQTKGIKNPAEIPKKIEEVKAVIGEVEGKLTQIKATAEVIQGEVTQMTGKVGEVDKWIAEDRSDLESKLKLPKIDTKGMANEFFAAMVLDKLELVRHYIALGRKYMPPKSPDKKDTKIVIQPRARGVDYEFGRPNSYPKFWLKLAELSSQANYSPFGGDMKGQITDITTNQDAIGKTTKLEMHAEFVKEGVHAIALTGNFDHRTDNAVDQVKLTVGEFQVPEKILIRSPQMLFAFTKATGSSQLEGVLKGNEISIDMGNRFHNMQYQTSSSVPILDQIIKGVASELKTVDVDAKVRGTWSDIQLSIESNIANAFSHSIERQLQVKLAEARAKINELIDREVGPRKKELLKKVDEVKAKALSEVESRRKQVDDIRAKALAKIEEAKKEGQSKVDAAKKEAEKKLGTEGKKTLDQLKKKLPF